MNDNKKRAIAEDIRDECEELMECVALWLEDDRDLADLLVDLRSTRDGLDRTVDDLEDGDES